MKLPDFLPSPVVLTALDLSPLGHALVDAASYQVLWSNRAYSQQMAGFADCRTILTAIERAHVAKQPIAVDVQDAPPAPGNESHWWLSALPLDTPEGSLLLVTLTRPAFGDSQEAISRDSLTGLADRGALDRRLAALPATPSDGWPPLTLLFIDLDGFKQINDQHGHLVGDYVISAVSRRIAAAVRGGDFLARYGGDEFVIVADGLRPGERLDLLVQRIRTAAQEPVETECGRLTLSASVGVAYSGEGFASPREMLAAADERMYADKRQSRPPSA